jgi:hypothetical protein
MAKKRNRGIISEKANVGESVAGVAAAASVASAASERRKSAGAGGGSEKVAAPMAAIIAHRVAWRKMAMDNGGSINNGGIGGVIMA